MKAENIHEMKLKLQYILLHVQSDVKIKRWQQKAHKLETVSVIGVIQIVIISSSLDNSVHQVQLLTSVNTILSSPFGLNRLNIQPSLLKTCHLT